MNLANLFYAASLFTFVRSLKSEKRVFFVTTFIFFILNSLESFEDILAAQMSYVGLDLLHKKRLSLTYSFLLGWAAVFAMLLHFYTNSFAMGGFEMMLKDLKTAFHTRTNKWQINLYLR